MIRIGAIAALAGALVAGLPSAGRAQGIDGHVSMMADALPHVASEGGERESYAELRARVLAERRFDLGGRVRLMLAGFADALVADRPPSGAASAGIVRPQEVHVEARWSKADLRIGWTRVIWGRLDEFLPTDVVNPQDLTRFFLEGRAEGRLPVAMVRARYLPSDRLGLEGLYVPFFRRGRFDQLDEPTSPFNVTPRTTCAFAPASPCVPLPLVTDAPVNRAGSAQGGLRLNATSGRVDWAISAYRGFESLPLYELSPQSSPPGSVLRERFPRFTMLGADFETVRGPWGLRGEVALFADRVLQAESSPTLAGGRALEAGIGADRRTGDYRVSASAIVTTRWTTESRAPAGARFHREDVLIVGSLDRSFARETRTLRAFAVYNPAESSAFGRIIASFSLRDDVALEMSGGLFDGRGVDALSRLASRDFVYLRLKVFF